MVFFDKFFIYQKLESFERLFWMKFRPRVLFQSSFVPLWDTFGDYTVFKNIYKRWYLI